MVQRWILPQLQGDIPDFINQHDEFHHTSVRNWCFGVRYFLSGCEITPDITRSRPHVLSFMIKYQCPSIVDNTRTVPDTDKGGLCEN